VLNKGLLQSSLLFFQGGPMAKVIIHLEETEHNALNELAKREYRTLPAQAAIIIHRQLQNLGLLSANVADSEISTDIALQNSMEA
jgi:hypothetical protein